MRELIDAISKIEQACKAAGRDPKTVEIELAVKTRTAEECLAAAQTLQNAGRPALLAHNRVQEALAMRETLAVNPQIHMSLIGPLQKNKINHALRCFHMVETVASVELATALSKRVQNTTPLPILIQVNTSGENTKHGLTPDQAIPTALAISELPHLQIQGFMTIGAHSDDPEKVRASFRALRQIRDQATTHGQLRDARTLSMGMSSDYAMAIAEGATRVRLGSMVFGSRK